MKWLKITLTVALLVSATSTNACVLHQASCAADGKQIAQATDPSQTTATTSQPLQGSVIKSVKEAQTGLNALAHTLTQLKHADTNLYNESTRQIANIMEEPEIVAGTVIYIPVSFSTGEYLPARRKWVDYYMSQLSQLVPLVQEDVDAILIPDDKVESCDQYMTQLKADIEDIQSQFKILQSLTQGRNTYDNNAMAAICHNIDREIKQMDEARKKAFHAVK